MMRQKQLFTVLVILVLTSLACGINFNLPSDIKTGPTETEDLQVPLPDTGGPIGLTLEFGAGEIYLEAGAGNALVDGTIRFNVTDFKPTITSVGDDVYIEQGDLNVSGIPNFDDKVINEWDLKLSDEPINLTIKAGAYQGRYEFGNLSLNRLNISDGASDVNLAFSDPNLIELQTFEYSTGASNVKMEGLSNANISTMTFRSGAGSYRLDFSGEIQRDMEVLVESGISSVVIVVPENIPATVKFDGGLSNIDYFGKWDKNAEVYTQNGDGFTINIRVKLGAGSLELRNK